MPTAANRDFHTVSTGKPDRLKYVTLSRDLHDRLRVAVRCQSIPDDLAPEIFVPGVRCSRHGPVDAAL